MQSIETKSIRGRLEFKLPASPPAETSDESADVHGSSDWEVITLPEVPQSTAKTERLTSELALAKQHKVEHLLQGEQIVLQTLLDLEPKAILRMGSLARLMQAKRIDFNTPRDVDLIYIGDRYPGAAIKDITRHLKISEEAKFDLWCYSPRHVELMAVALLKVPSIITGTVITAWDLVTSSIKQQLLARHLIGPDYYRFSGLENGEIAMIPDLRDYSVHQTLAGEEWWSAVRAPLQEKISRPQRGGV